jgi:uncharacterized protein YdiU (UPF0061 family)
MAQTPISRSPATTPDLAGERRARLGLGSRDRGDQIVEATAKVMPRHKSGFDVHFRRLEEDLYAIGDARDWAKAEEDRLLGYLDKLERGALSFNQVRSYIREDFTNVNKDIDQWESVFSGDAIQVKFPYLHQSLKVASIVVPLPIPDGVA